MAALARRLEPRTGTGERGNAGVDEGVVDDDIGLRQRRHGVERQVAGIARPGTDQPDMTRLEPRQGGEKIAEAVVKVHGGGLQAGNVRNKAERPTRMAGMLPSVHPRAAGNHFGSPFPSSTGPGGGPRKRRW